ncbi:MAG TPA: hypothetical protein PK760_08075, partial [Flavobacteriales bacterium]|nr:hypothetical protein [Flavobacteriales bacterium]
RWVSALLHVLLFCGVLLAALIRTQASVRWTAIGACLYLFYLAYVQRGVEERYTLPVLFVAVGCTAFLLSAIRPSILRVGR